MPLTHDQELWGVALWVEKTHADAGWLFIAQQQDRLLAEGDLDGVAMWREVSKRYEKLNTTPLAASDLRQSASNQRGPQRRTMRPSYIRYSFDA